MTALSRAACAALDASDPLAAQRADFALPAGVLYLDGNSLGALPHATRERLRRVVDAEWGEGLIGSWNAAGWIDLPRRVGDAIGTLIGARAGEVTCADSTSVNLFKVLAVALQMAARGERCEIVSERDNFPTDLYIAQGLARLLDRGIGLRLVDDAADLPAALGPQTAVLLLTHVNYRTGALHDMAALTAAAHAVGALAVWDLAHSAGAVPVDLTAAGADFAVGCGYKYLNGGPGAPAFLWVPQRHHDRFEQPLSGWLGHAAPFAFEPGYRPAEGIARYLAGTPPILSLAALEEGVRTVTAAGIRPLRAKSVALTDLFIALVDARCEGFDLALVTPRAAAARGSQVSLRHPHAYAVMQALIARGVVGDFRAPDLLRFGFAPLYVRHTDCWDAVEALREVLAARAWDQPQFHRRSAVT